MSPRTPASPSLHPSLGVAVRAEPKQVVPEVPSSVEVPGLVSNLPDSGGERKGRAVLLMDGKSTLLPCNDPPGKCSFVVAQVCSLSSGDVLHEQGSLVLAVPPGCQVHGDPLPAAACCISGAFRAFLTMWWPCPTVAASVRTPSTELGMAPALILPSRLASPPALAQPQICFVGTTLDIFCNKPQKSSKNTDSRPASPGTMPWFGATVAAGHGLDFL